MRDFDAYPEPKNPPSCPVLEVKPWFWALADRLYRSKSGRVPFDPNRDSYECLILMDAFDAATSAIEAARARGFSDPQSESIHKHNRELLSKAGVGRK